MSVHLRAVSEKTGLKNRTKIALWHRDESLIVVLPVLNGEEKP